MRRALSFAFLVLALAGCKGSREKDVVGSWSSQGMTLTANEDKSFKSSMGPMSIDGTWAVEGSDATFTPKNLNGKPIADLKAQFMKAPGAVPAQAKQFVEDMDKPSVMTLSEDGKSMTTNKAKDKNAGPDMTLTKA